MIIDKYGQQVYTEADLINVFYTDPESKLKNVLVDRTITIDPDLEIDDIISFVEDQTSGCSIDEFDQKNQDTWFMPKEYLDFDIAKFVLDKCTCDAELQRAGQELLLFQEKNMFPLLQYLKYLVDLMRDNNIVWGVGRGSSVASFVLYLIGVHRINSLEYDLDIEEFIR